MWITAKFDEEGERIRGATREADFWDFAQNLWRNTTNQSALASSKLARRDTTRTCLELSSSSGFVSVASSGVVSASHTRVSSSTLPSPPSGEDCLVRQSSRASSAGTSGSSRDAGAMSARPPGRGAGQARGVSRLGSNGRSHSRGRRVRACVASRGTRRARLRRWRKRSSDECFPRNVFSTSAEISDVHSRRTATPAGETKVCSLGLRA